VALTRAIEELYVFVPSRVGNTVNPARFLIPQTSLSVGTPALRPAAHEKTKIHQKLKGFISAPWAGRLQEEFFDQPPVFAVLAQQGEFYHAVLMHVDRVNKDNVEFVLKTACKKACRRLAPPGDIEGCLEILRHFLDRDDVYPFFYLPEDAEVYCEKEFVNAYGDTKRLDRLIVLEGEVWIVDYKMSAPAQPEHNKQMGGYVELVRQFYPKHKVTGSILYLQS
jgi:ATP-dependent exoDNAse (exonuclease V) beta subunit